MQERETLLTSLLAQVPQDRTGVAKAYLFALFSIQTTVRIHERAYRSFIGRYPTHGAMMDLTVAQWGEELRTLGLNLWSPKAKAAYAAMRDPLESYVCYCPTLSDKNARQWVAEVMPGLSYAKASFFLMLLGRLEVACLDVHMLRLLKTGRTSAPKTRKAYERIEAKLGERAGLRQWLRWIDHMGIPGVGHEVYFASQGVLN